MSASRSIDGNGTYFDLENIHEPDLCSNDRRQIISRCMADMKLPLRTVPRPIQDEREGLIEEVERERFVQTIRRHRMLDDVTLRWYSGGAICRKAVARLGCRRRDLRTFLSHALSGAHRTLA